MNGRTGLALTGAFLIASSVALAGTGGADKQTGPAAAVASTKTQVDAAKENVKKAREELRTSRAARQKAHREEIRAKLKEVATRPDARDELRAHGRRLARLHHMRTLSKELGRDALVKRVDGLIAKENARFERRVDELRRGVPAGEKGERGKDKQEEGSKREGAK